MKDLYDFSIMALSGSLVALAYDILRSWRRASAHVLPDKKQLKKVFAYFGISTSLLDQVEDVGKGQNLSGPDYNYGVQYIK